MNYVRSDAVVAIRKRLNHPVIDGDGHLIEYLPLVRDFLVEEAGEDVAKGFDRLVHGSELARLAPLDRKRELGLSRSAWWGLPAKNTLDRATAMLPDLLHRRCDELGIDYAMLYPTYGLVVTALGEDELRRACARAFNRYYAEVYADVRDRLEPVAAIPMFTPEEALAELDHAIATRGLKSGMFAGVIPRRVPGAEQTRGATYIDNVAHDSLHDYDPVWRRCAELGIAPTFHAGGQGWGTRASRTNYVYNHIGNFAAAGEAACRGLVLGGVPHRFPQLRFAFLEGGVAWALNFYSDLLGHYEKRNRDAIRNYDPAALDRAQLEKLFREHAPAALRARLDRLDEALLMLSDPKEDPASIDEFAASGARSAEDFRAIFERQFFFGCEADDPMNALAFEPRFSPGGAKLRAIFASDIGHWDVPEISEVLPEAYELVEEKLLSEADFRAFACDNAIALFGGANPKFFEGTGVAEHARRVLASS
jgi:predicted TIM-barrel fold metal-dependent hydrolase